MAFQVKVERLDEFRQAMSAAADDMKAELDEEMKEAAERIRLDAARRAPRRSGRLAGGYRVTKKAPLRYEVDNEAPHAPGAEFGQTGKWKGFRRYGPRAKRFLFAAMADIANIADDVMQRVEKLLKRTGFLS